jgi:hypothetical protein
MLPTNLALLCLSGTRGAALVLPEVQLEMQNNTNLHCNSETSNNQTPSSCHPHRQSAFNHRVIRSKLLIALKDQ